MLSLSEFSCSPICDVRHLALILPRNEHEQRMILGTMSDRWVAVFIGEKFRFECFEAGDNSNWAGLVVADISIEVDEETAFDPNQDHAPLGALLRQKAGLFIRASFGQAAGGAKICLVDGLSQIAESYGVGFLKWQVVVGRQAEKRILATIDVRQQEIN